MGKRLVSAEDLQSFEWASNPLVSPNGQWVVFEKTVANKKEDDYETHLMLAKPDGSLLRPLTTAGSKNHSAVFSPDGKTLAFLSNRAYGSQLWLLPMEGGEARQVTRFKRGIGGLCWSPDGHTLFGLVPAPKGGDVEVFSEGVSTGEAKDEADKEAKDWANDPKRYDWLYYKADGSGFSKGLVPQLVAVDAETGAHRQLTRGEYGVHSPAVSPDSRYVAFASNRREDHENVHASDIYRVPVDGGDMELLCSDTIAYDLAYAPDGKQIAFFGHRDEFRSATHLALYLIPANGGDGVKVSGDFPDTLGGEWVLSDMRMGSDAPGPVWSRDCKYIYALSPREGRCDIIRFTLAGDHAQAEVVVGGDRAVYGFSLYGESTFVMAYATPTHPGKVVVVDIAGVATKPRTFRAVTEPMLEQRIEFFPSVETRLDNCSDEFLDELTLVEPEPFWFTSAEGWRVHGWVMKPANYEAGKKYPVIVEVHGGPQMSYGYTLFHEMQWFAAQGYAIVFVNPRGSMSYGQEFVNAVRHHYGENDAQDVLNGLSSALERFDFLDGERVALTGGSYGGFMTNWLVGHTDRFFAAVSQRSISNWISFYGCSDIGPLFVEAQLGTDVWSDVEKLWEMSPLAYVQNVKTPLLLVHSEQDYRCPIEQAEQFYTCIKRRGGEVELLRINNASHGLSRNGKPSLRLARVTAIFNYINDHLPTAK